MIKRTIALILLACVVLVCLAQTNKLEQYQVSSFGGVTRISFTFTTRPITNVLKEANSLRVVIGIPNCDIGNVPTRFTTPDALASAINITRQNRELSVEISTNTAFASIRQSANQSQRYTLYIDIFRNSPPQSISDYVALLDYYNATRNSAGISETQSSIPLEYSENNRIIDRLRNRYTAPLVYTPRPTRPPATTTPPPTQTVTVTRPQDVPTTVKPPTTPPTPPAQVTPPTTPPVTPPTQPNIPTQLPPAATSTNTDLANASFTLIARSDRFPSRIAQTKDIFNPDRLTRTPPQPTTPEPVTPPPVQPPPTTTETTPPPAVAPPPPEVTPPPTVAEPPRRPTTATPTEVIRSAIDIADLQDIERQILNYYNIVKIDSARANFMVGLNASIAGDYHTAIDYLKTIPETDVNYENAILWLRDSYTEVGDTKNADFYNSLLKVTEPVVEVQQADVSGAWSKFMSSLERRFIKWAAVDTTETEPDSLQAAEIDLINAPVKLWITVAIGLVALIIGIILTIIFANRAKKKKKGKEPITDADINVHKKNIETKYENKDIYNKDTIEVLDNETDEKIADKYDDPPIVTEKLNKQEEEELIADEKQAATPPPANEPPPVPDEDFESLKEGNYKRNMVLKLHNDGWEIDAIAKEVQISQHEIEFILKNPE